MSTLDHQRFKYFGRKMLDQYHYDTEKAIYINNGSWGSSPKVVVEKQQELQIKMHQNPNQWFQWEAPKLKVQSLECIAQHTKSKPEDIVFVTNATEGICTVITSMNLQQNDKVLVFDINYGQVHKILQFLQIQDKIQIVKIILDEKTINSDELILNKVQQACVQFWPIKLAIVDHISSAPSVLMPIKEITSILKKYNTTVFIDGAHAIGQTEVDIPSINCDYFTCNLHKWCQVPRSCAILWTRKELQSTTYPMYISFFYDLGYQKAFQWQGTMDDSRYMVVKEALEFRNRYGDQNILDYQHLLAVEVGKVVSSIWKTEVLIKDPNRIGALVGIKLPIQDPEIIDRVQRYLTKKYDAFMHIAKFSNNQYYIRLSCQIFNEISDFEKIANEFISLAQEYHSKPEKFLKIQKFMHGPLQSIETLLGLQMIQFLRFNNYTKSLTIYKFLSQKISTQNKQFFFNLLKQNLSKELFEYLKISETPLFDNNHRCTYFYVNVANHNVLIPQLGWFLFESGMKSTNRENIRQQNGYLLLQEGSLYLSQIILTIAKSYNLLKINSVNFDDKHQSDLSLIIQKTLKDFAEINQNSSLLKELEILLAIFLDQTKLKIVKEIFYSSQLQQLKHQNFSKKHLPTHDLVKQIEAKIHDQRIYQFKDAQNFNKIEIQYKKLVSNIIEQTKQNVFDQAVQIFDNQELGKNKLLLDIENLEEALSINDQNFVIPKL